MIQQIIHRLLLRRHFWRHASFSEVAELYASRTTRMFALRMVATFTSIYLIQKGYSPVDVVLLFAAFYAYKAFIIAWPASLLIARIGPKHATLISNVLMAISLPFLAAIESHGIVAIVLWVLFQAASNCLYDLAYLVDFSKVKNVKHAGKEIAFMNIFEKVAASISPLVGGVLAFVLGPEAIMWIAAALFLVSALPLFFTPEPVRIKQRLLVRGFPWRTTWRSMLGEVGTGIDAFISGTAWTLAMAIIIFAGEGDEIYAKVGALTSLAIIAAIFASYIFGRLIDHRRGGELLRISTIFNALVHAMRAFTTTPAGVGMINVANELGTTGYAMPFIRGLFDTADRSGHRLFYLLCIEIAANLGLTLAALLCAGLLALMGDPTVGLQTFFVIGGTLTLIIAMPRFVLYRK